MSICYRPKCNCGDALPGLRLLLKLHSVIFFSTQVKRITKQHSDITCYAETLPEVRLTNNTLNKSTVCLYSIVKQSQTRKEPLWRQQTAEQRCGANITACWEPVRS